MILIQRYIFKELLYNFAFTFVVITMIMLLAMSVKIIFKYPALGFLMLIKNLPIMLSASLTIVIPAAVLVATVITYGRIASDNEIVTMRASGIHVLRILLPGILFGLMASLTLLVINDKLVPSAERQIKSMESTINLTFLLDMALKSGEKKLELDKWLLTWERCEKEILQADENAPGGQIEGWRFYGLRVKLFEDDKITLSEEIWAESAYIEARENGRKFVPCLFKGEFVHGKEGSFERLVLPAFEFAAPRKSKIRPSMRSISSLAAMKGRVHKAYPDYKMDTELHKRIADSFSPLVFVFLSLPVALLFKQQNRMVAFLISILLALFIYYPVSLLGVTFAKEGYLDPILSIWSGITCSPAWDSYSF